MRTIPIPAQLNTLPRPDSFGAQFHGRDGANLYWIVREGDGTGGRVAVHPRPDIELVEVVDDDASQLTIEDVRRDLDDAFAGRFWP